MIRSYRKRFNEEYSAKNNEQVHHLVKERFGMESGFRLSESPIFLSKTLQDQLYQCGQSIIDQIKAMSSDELLKSVPSECNVPNDTTHPHFIAIDYALCTDEEGIVTPRLIELQGFPSLFAFQGIFQDVLYEVYPWIKELQNNLSLEEYTETLRSVIIGKEDPKHVILLEIYPDQQKTSIDFRGTEILLGIQTVCLTKVIKEGKKLFYIDKEGVKTPINRIYNRIILDELNQIKDLDTSFRLQDDVDVEWVTHPNWFFKISKSLLPKLSHPFIPKSYFLDSAPDNLDLQNYVLKPLYSFAGSGVNLNPTEKDLDTIKDKENFILQEKVSYAPLFEDINGEYSKAEIRLLYYWHEDWPNPKLAVNLVRMTKAMMVNVSFNKKDAIWIGSSLAIFEEE